jgi:hypothetical protein
MAFRTTVDIGGYAEKGMTLKVIVLRGTAPDGRGSEDASGPSQRDAGSHKEAHDQADNRTPTVKEGMC